MTIGKRVIAAALVLVLLFALAACTQLTYPDEVQMMFRFLKFHSNPETLNVTTLQKYEVSKLEIYYYVEWASPANAEEPIELLVIYNTQTTLIDLAHFEDMEAGLFADEKQMWDRLKTQEPDRTFTQAEIDEIVNEAAGLESV